MLKKLKNLLQNEIDPAFSKRAEFIFKEIEKEKPKKILDIGCGRGFYINAFSLYSFPKEIHGVDINERYLLKAKRLSGDKRIKINKASIYKLPFKDNYFDFIVCSEVLEHLKNDQKGLKELKRVLKKKGKIIITVPNYNFPFLWDPLNWILMRIFNTHINKNIWWLAGIWADHERLYKRDQLVNLVKKNRLAVEKIEFTTYNCWPFSHFILYGIGKNIVERFGFSKFDRFNQEDRPLSRMISKVMAFPQLLDGELDIYSVGLSFSVKHVS